MPVLRKDVWEVSERDFPGASPIQGRLPHGGLSQRIAVYVRRTTFAVATRPRPTLLAPGSPHNTIHLTGFQPNGPAASPGMKRELQHSAVRRHRGRGVVV
jgi:hypothetical protein